MSTKPTDKFRQNHHNNNICAFRKIVIEVMRCAFCCLHHFDAVDISFESNHLSLLVATFYAVCLSLCLCSSQWAHRNYTTSTISICFAEISPLQTISNEEIYVSFFLRFIDRVFNVSPVWNASYYLRGDEFSTICSFALWRCRADAHVCRWANVCECLPFANFYDWSLLDYVENVNNFDIRWIFIFAFVPFSNYRIIHSSNPFHGSDNGGGSISSLANFLFGTILSIFFLLQAFLETKTCKSILKNPKKRSVLEMWIDFFAPSLSLALSMWKMRSPSHFLCQLEWMNFFCRAVSYETCVCFHFQICMAKFSHTKMRHAHTFRRHWTRCILFIDFSSQHHNKRFGHNLPCCCCVTKSNIHILRPYLSLGIYTVCSQQNLFALSRYHFVNGNKFILHSSRNDIGASGALASHLCVYLCAETHSHIHLTLDVFAGCYKTAPLPLEMALVDFGVRIKCAIVK